MAGIDIGTILNKFDDMVDERTSEVKTYGVRYLKKREGNQVTGEILKARKGVKNPKAERKGSPDERGKFRINLKMTGNILLFDEEKQRYRAIKVANIYAFRDHGSNFWIDRV